MESFSRLKEIKFSLVTDLPKTEDMYSLFLNNKSIAGIMKVKITKFPLEIRLDILKIVMKIKKELVHKR